MQIGILGSGLMGGTLGTLFARAGHGVVFSYARTPGKLEQLAAAAGERARAGTPLQAAQGADALLLAVHWSRLDDVLGQAGDLAGATIITCSLAMDAGNAGMVIGLTTSAAEVLARRLPQSRIVCAFNTVPGEMLPGIYRDRRTADRPSLVYCGDDAPSKAVAAELIRDIGFAPIDAGPLRIARYTEPFALLVGQLAYEGAEGPELAYRFVHIGA